MPKIPIGVLLSLVPDGLDPALALAKELHATSLNLPSKQSAANVFAKPFSPAKTTERPGLMSY